MTGIADAEFTAIPERAIAVGRESVIRDAILEISKILRQAPREFGEPLRHFRAMRMTVRNAAVRPLSVEFGVHDVQPLVVIRRFR